MGTLGTLEKQIGDIYKGAPKLSASAKESLTKVWPWLALIGGVLQLLVAWGLYDLVRRIDRLSDVLNTFSIYQTAGLTSIDKTLIYLGIIMLVVDAAILLMAYPELKKRAKRGWDLIFLAAVINAGYSVVQLFTRDRGVSAFIASLIGSIIVFYLLFQIREKFGGASASKPKS